jgi:hydrogenase-4 component H
MNILTVLSQNFGRGSRTRKPADAVPYPDGFRGPIHHAEDLCIACGACAYACSPSAIKLDESNPEAVVWKYTEDRCTFCGFCVQYCPTQALSFEAVSPQPLSERSQHYLTHSIALQPCRECGQPMRLIPEVVLKRIYGDPIPEDIVQAQGLCERCRQRATGSRFKKAMINL